MSWSEVLIAAADDSKYWGKEVRRPAMIYLARGKEGGEPTAAYEEDPTGITAKVQAQLQGGGHEPPPVSDPTIIKRRKKTRAEKKAAKVLVTAFTGGGAPPGGGGGQGASRAHRRAPHPLQPAGAGVLAQLARVLLLETRVAEEAGAGGVAGVRRCGREGCRRAEDDGGGKEDREPSLSHFGGAAASRSTDTAQTARKSDI